MYLTQRHFNQTFIIALLLHLAFLIIYAINIQIEKIHVSQKPLYIKLGNKPNISEGKKNINRERQKISNKPVIKSTLTQPKQPLPLPKSMQAPVKTQIMPPIQSTETIIETKELKPTKTIKAKNTVKPNPPAPIEKPEPPPLIKEFSPPIPANKPKISGQAHTGHQEIPFVQHLRSKKHEVEGISGNKLGNRSVAEQEVIQNYEQQLALWLQKHKVYPLSARRQGLEGEAIVRVQIDRIGNVRFYEVAESTGKIMLDDSVRSMVERSDPVPPVPDDYPGGYVIEFLLPVTFKLN